jgi:hypothetical protein
MYRFTELVLVVCKVIKYEQTQQVFLGLTCLLFLVSNYCILVSRVQFGSVRVFYMIYP